MKPLTLTLGILTSTIAIACGHGTAPKSAASLRGSGQAAAPATEPAGGAATADASGEAAPAPAAKSAGAAAPRAPGALQTESEQAMARRERPGLGTSWGEARSSHVSSTSFTRDSQSPFAMAALYYNDVSGVNAQARGRFVDYTESVMSYGDAIVSITDGGGRPLRAARVDGRTIVVGQDGDRYVIRVENRSPSRLEAVATVDGLDVIDGSDGDPSKRGYVIPAYDTLEIEGFRDSEGSVRTFRFGATDSAYASRVGKGRNVGVIGVALYREQGADPRWTPEEIRRRNDADPFPNRYAPPPPPPPPGAWRAQ